MLDAHNLETMSPGFFRDVAARMGLNLESLDYLGSIEPALPFIQSSSTARRTFGTVLAKSILWLAAKARRFRFMDDVNHPLFSSYLIASYKKGRA